MHIQRAIPLRILRSDEAILLTLTPRKNWGGRGMLGYILFKEST